MADDALFILYVVQNVHVFKSVYVLVSKYEVKTCVASRGCRLIAVNRKQQMMIGYIT